MQNYTNHHVFNTLQEFHTYLTNSDTKKKHQDEARVPGQEEWYGASFEDAMDMLLHGTTDPRYSLEPKTPQKLPVKSTQTRRTPHTSPVGYAPHIQNFLRNLPNSMISTRTLQTPTQARGRRHITIVKNVSYNCGWTVDSIRAINIKTTQYIRELCMAPDKPLVTVYALSYSKFSHRDRTIKNQAVYVRVKAPDQRLIVPQLNFALCCPAFLRRCMLRWMEVCPKEFIPYVPYGYGHSLSIAPDNMPFKGEVLYIAADHSTPT